MVIIALPGADRFMLEHLVLDLNGTVALDGVLLDGVARRISALAREFHVALVTADTHGRAAEIGNTLQAEVRVIDAGDEGSQKAEYVRWLGADSTVAIGNGANDAQMLAIAAVGICVIGPEGAAAAAVSSADIVTTSIGDALDVLANPTRLAATLRR